MVLVDRFLRVWVRAFFLMGIFHNGDASVVDLDVGMWCSPASSSLSESVIDESIESFQCLQHHDVNMVKRIPRSARHKAAIVFESCLRDVINVGSLPHWDRLFILLQLYDNLLGMGANHGGAWGGLAPPEIILGGLAMDPDPPEKTGFSPPTFSNMRGLTRLIVTISPSTFSSYN